MRSTWRPNVRAALLAAVVATVALASGPPARAAVPAPAPAFGPLDAPIRPGIATDTGGQVCTANFVFTDDRNRFYVGQSGHCAQDASGDAPDPETCSFGRQFPLGTPVGLGASGVSGKLAYSSWLTMTQRGESQPDICRWNDFSLVRIPADAIGQVNPTVPLFGGPTGLNTEGTAAGDLITGLGNSPLRQGLEPLAPKQSIAVYSEPGGRAHQVYSISPGVPGDSGGPYLDPQGRALGSLSEISLDPPGANILTDIARAVEYAARYGGIPGLRIVPGTAPFTGPVLVGSLLGAQLPPGRPTT